MNVSSTTANSGASFKASKSAVKEAAMKKQSFVSDEDFGMQIARKYNPHYRKEEN